MGKVVQVFHFGDFVACQAKLGEEGRVKGGDGRQVITAEEEACEWVGRRKEKVVRDTGEEVEAGMKLLYGKYECV